MSKGPAFNDRSAHGTRRKSFSESRPRDRRRVAGKRANNVGCAFCRCYSRRRNRTRSTAGGSEGILTVASSLHGFKLDFVNFDLGGRRYLETGEILPTSVLEELKKVDAIYLGAIGHPDVPPGILEKGILLRLRVELDQYVNLRPVKLYPHVETPLKDKSPDQIDFLVVRENTEGFYVGSGGFFKWGTPDEVAIQESVNTRKGIERLLRYSFEATRARAKEKKLTLCGKTNVLTYAWDLWMRIFKEISEEYPTSQQIMLMWTQYVCGW